MGNLQVNSLRPTTIYSLISLFLVIPWLKGCDKGWKPPDCVEKCSNGTYGYNCLNECGHCFDGPSFCNAADGVCKYGCEEGWKLKLCKIRCDHGTYGADCDFKCGHCLNPTCDSVYGRCDGGCQIGWKPPLCKEAYNSSIYGTVNCGHCEGEMSLCDVKTGHCKEGCKMGWQPPLCKEVCKLGTFGEHCNDTCGNCDDEQPVCDPVNGSCPGKCKDGWKASLCKELIIPDNAVVIASVLGCTLMVILIGALMRFLYYHKKNKQQKSTARRRALENRSLSFHQLSEMLTMEEPTSSRYNSLVSMHKKISPSYSNIVQDVPFPQINWEDIKTLGILGQGHFGVVYKAMLPKQDNLMVAMKTLIDSNIDEEWQNFVEEMKIMERIGEHPNIVQLLGICYHRSKIFMLTEFLSNGDLRTFLRKSRTRMTEAYENIQPVTSFISSKRLLQYALDVAKGMNHLACKQILHRDLAARNVLIGNDDRAKISDFGLSRKGSLYLKVTNSLLPIRWMAVESLDEQTYTIKSDVWSFGVLLWEIETLGETPYAHEYPHILIPKLKSGYRLPRPVNCNQVLYELMLTCWLENPNERPDFYKLIASIEDLLENQLGYLQLL